MDGYRPCDALGAADETLARDGERKHMNNQKSGQGSSAPSQTGGARRSDGGSQKAGSSSTVTSQVQGALDQQVVRGARMMSSVAQSTKLAADELENDAPQIADVVRSVADRLEQYSRNLENQSVNDLYMAATDFTRRQPAVVFGMAALAGFFALRTLKSSQSSAARRAQTASRQGGQFHGS
jgi:hypothetical protein